MSLDNNNICFNDLIGITRSKCKCLSDKPVGWNKSKSGQYLDDATFGVPMHSEMVCWDELPNLYEQSVQQTKELFLTALGGDKGIFNDRIGVGGKSTYASKNQYVGTIITPLSYLGRVLRIKKLTFAVDLIGKYNISVYGFEGDGIAKGEIECDPLHTFQVEVTKIKGQTEVNLNGLDFRFDCNGLCTSYVFVLDLKEVDSEEIANPVNYKYTECSTCQKKQPKYQQQKKIIAKGFDIAEVCDINLADKGTVNTGGFLIDFDIVCDPFGWACDADEYFWKNTYFGIRFARTLKMVWALNYIEASQSNMNFFNATSLSNVNFLERQMQKLNSEVYGTEERQGMFEYLVSSNSMPEGLSSCFGCKQKYIIKKVNSKVIF